MKPKNIIINIAILILVLIILFIGFQLVFSDKEDSGSASGGLVPAGFLSSDGSTARSAEFLEALESVQDITFSTAIFESPAFSTLKDFSVTLVAKPKGRINPFAPLGVGNIAPEGGDTESTENDTSTSTEEVVLSDDVEVF